MDLTRRARRNIRRLIFVISLVVLAVLFHRPLLRAMGSFLIYEDAQPTGTPVLVVLGGNSFERGTAAFDLHRQQPFEEIWCTGGNIPSAFLALDTAIYEAELSAMYLKKRGVSEKNLRILTGSTSTWEEAFEVKEACESARITSITILSSKFHTRRVRSVFRKVFENSEVDLYFAGAPPLTYDIDSWWKEESGLLMVNNELVKTLYYFLVY